MSPFPVVFTYLLTGLLHRLYKSRVPVAPSPRLGVLPAKQHNFRVEPRGFESLTSAVQRQQRGFSCVLMSKEFRISKPYSKCLGESLFCCFHLSSNWVAARLLHTRRVLFGLFAILSVAIVGLVTWAAVRYRGRVLGSLPPFGALSTEPLRLA